MRIVAVCGFAWEPKGTARARAFPIMSELASRGHHVTLLTVPYDNPALSGSEFTRDGVVVKGLELRAGYSRVVELPFRAVREIEDLAPDVVHIFKPKGYAGAIASLLLRKGQLPTCVDCDDWEGWGGWNELKSYPMPVKAYIDWQEKWLTRRAHALTVASRTLLERALEIGQAPERTCYAPNCVTSAQYEALGEVALRDSKAAKRALGLSEKPLILYTGHFEPVDNVLFFCRAVAPALREGAAVALVGDGEEISKVKEYFAGISMAKDVYYFGRLPYPNYLDVIAAADVACFPYPDNSVYHSKCSARIIDYMAATRPVVTTNVGQNPEYIENGKSGILVSPGAASQFAESLKVLLQHPELRSSLGAEARKRIGERFMWSTSSVNQCEQAYFAAAAQRARLHSDGASQPSDSEVFHEV